MRMGVQQMNRRRVPSPRGNARDWAPRAVALFARSALALCCAGLIVAMPAVHASSNVTSPATASPVSLAELLAPKPATQPGQSATQLADGRWLLLGGGTGSSISRAAVVLDAAGASMALGATMTQARSGQAATLMPDGRVLVLGGLGRDGSIVDTAEIFDPASGTFTTAGSLGLLARTEQSATVLADGRLLIAGGVDGKGFAVQDVELLDPVSGQLERLGTPLDAARLQHVAALLPDTNVLLWGGSDPQGQALGSGDLFNSTAQTFSATTADASRALAASLTGTAPPALLDSIPAASATQVPVTQRLMLRLSKRMSVASLNATTVTLVGPEGPVKINPVAVDGGVLLFVTPQQQLLPDSAFTLFVQGATDEYGQPLPMVAVGFRTAALGGTTSTARGTATASVVASPATAAATLKSAAGAAAP
ncbi:MAG TPA: kelch repeat-containing protein, partial [Burkholderiaceae bacterium]